VTKHCYGQRNTFAIQVWFIFTKQSGGLDFGNLVECEAESLITRFFPGLIGLIAVEQDDCKPHLERSLLDTYPLPVLKARWRTPMRMRTQNMNPLFGISAKVISSSLLVVAGLSLISCGQSLSTSPITPETTNIAQIDSSGLPTELATELTAQAATISGQLLYSKTAALPSSAYYSQIFIQPDQRTVVASINTSEGLLVSRFLPNGKLDPSFGTNGSVSFDVAPGFDRPYDVTADNEGRVLIAGTSQLGFFDWDAFVIRLTSRGGRDGSFANNGAFVRRAIPTAPYNIGATTGNVARQIRLVGHKIVVLGTVAAPNTPQPFVWRLNNRGALDTSFAGDGEAVLDPTGSPSSSLFYGLDVRPNGKVVISSTDQDFVDSPDLIPRNHAYIAQLSANGSLDAGFGTAGVAKIVVEANNFNSGSLAVLNNGQVILTGSSDLFRFGATGTLEKTNLGGVAAGAIRGIVPLSDGKILLSGDAGSSVFLARFDKDLNLDTGFATAGYFQNGFGLDAASVSDVCVNGATYSLATGGAIFNPFQDRFVYSIIAR
jgi:uncharacterized delta-60 repeat protein